MANPSLSPLRSPLPLPSQNQDSPTWNIGYTTRNHLCLDLDNTSYFKVKSLVNLLMCSYPEIGDCIILLSSSGKLKLKWNYPPCKMPTLTVKRENYHVVFNNNLPYETCCKIIETLAFLDVISEEFIRIREMRNDMTLRVSKTVNATYTKPKPLWMEYVYNYNCKEKGKGISNYWRLKKAVT
jgi:hypothetical protein